MIVTDELSASLDDGSANVILHRAGVESRRLEVMAAGYADKVQILIENNEKLLESKSVGLGLVNEHQGDKRSYNKQGGVGGGYRGGDKGGNKRR